MELLLKYFPNLDEEQINRFAALQALYAEWNEQINVISRKDVENLYERHVLHSLAITKVVPFKNGSWVLDVGTGGGFPGIPLAIFFPKVRFHLVDSIGKKLKVVEAVADALDLQNVTWEHKRMEEVEFQYDFVVTRAVARTEKLMNWLRGMTRPASQHTLKNGLLALKGGDLTDELKPFYNRGVRTFPISQYFEEPFFEEKKVIYLPLK